MRQEEKEKGIGNGKGREFVPIETGQPKQSRDRDDWKFSYVLAEVHKHHSEVGLSNGRVQDKNLK